MAGKALSTIGVKFGWQLATATSSGYTYETAWEQIEECVSIGGVETTKDKLDATPLESEVKKYVGGHADTGGELVTTFNASDTFEAQWAKMMTAYDGKTTGKVLAFCAYHPDRAKMHIYIVEPGVLPRPEYSVGSVLQYSISNVLVDLPEDITKVEPTVTA